MKMKRDDFRTSGLRGFAATGLVLCLFCLIGCICFAAPTKKPVAPTKKPTAPAMPKDRESLAAAVSKSLRADREVYIYFYTNERDESRKWIPNVKQWADKRKADFYVIDADGAMSGALSVDYGISFRPTVVRLKRGYGIVETYSGPSETARFAKSPTAKPISEFAKRVSALTAKDAAVIIEFYADWCQPCVEMKPFFEQVETRTSGRIRILRVNVDGELDGIKLYGVVSPPENVLMDSDGVVRRRFSRISGPGPVLQYAVSAGIVSQMMVR